MITVRTETVADLDVDEVLALYDSVGWAAYTRDPETLRRALSGSHRIVTARQDGRLAGLARSVSDGASIVYVQDILVSPACQRSGVGRRLISTLLDHYPGVRQRVLLTDAKPGQRAFYESLGLTEVHDADPPLRAFVDLRPR